MPHLFGQSFEYDDKKDLIDWLEEIDSTQAITIIDLALSHANKEGAFDIDESYCIFKCINKLKELKTNGEGIEKSMD